MTLALNIEIRTNGLIGPSAVKRDKGNRLYNMRVDILTDFLDSQNLVNNGCF